MNRREATERWHQKWHAYFTITGLGPNATHYEMRPRYMERCAGTYGVCWQPPIDDRLTLSRMGYVDDVRTVGLRLVGRVEAETLGREDCWSAREHCGWYTEPDGEVFKDGTGLCWGVVYQLPTRRKHMRFVAGYQFGGCDNGPTLDFGRIFRDRCRGENHSSPPRDVGGALEAARLADDLARDAAERECEYQRSQREEDEEDEDEENDDALEREDA